MARKLLLCGVLSPLLYAVADGVGGASYAGYSFRDQTISELGAVGAPSRLVFSLLLLVVYLLLVGFGVGVWRSAGTGRALRIAGGAIVAFGVLALTVGQFVPMHQRGVEQGLAGVLHLVEGAVAMLLVVVAIASAASALGGRFRVYSIATLAVMVGFGAWSGADIARVAEGLPTPWIGFRERVFWYSYEMWFAVTALALLGDRAGRARTAMPLTRGTPSPRTAG